jgi:hypothetical protein
MKPQSNRKRWFYRQWFHVFNAFVNLGIATLRPSEVAVYLILLHKTGAQYGTTSVGLADLARLGGMSRTAAGTAVRSLVEQGKVRVVRRGVPGRPTLYTVFDGQVFAKLNPVAAQWMHGGADLTTHVGQTKHG